MSNWSFNAYQRHQIQTEAGNILLRKMRLTHDSFPFTHDEIQAQIDRNFEPVREVVLDRSHPQYCAYTMPSHTISISCVWPDLRRPARLTIKCAAAITRAQLTTMPYNATIDDIYKIANIEKNLKLYDDILTPDRREAVVDWVNRAVAEQQTFNVVTDTIKRFMLAVNTYYDLMAWWPSLMVVAKNISSIAKKSLEIPGKLPKYYLDNYRNPLRDPDMAARARFTEAALMAAIMIVDDPEWTPPVSATVASINNK